MLSRLIIRGITSHREEHAYKRYHLSPRSLFIAIVGCFGKEAACDACNRLHFVPGHTLLPEFTLSCTRNDLTFHGQCRSIYFGHLGFQGAVTGFVTEGPFQVH